MVVDAVGIRDPDMDCHRSPMCLQVGCCYSTAHHAARRAWVKGLQLSGLQGPASFRTDRRLNLHSSCCLSIDPPALTVFLLLPSRTTKPFTPTCPPREPRSGSQRTLQTSLCPATPSLSPSTARSTTERDGVMRSFGLYAL